MALELSRKARLSAILAGLDDGDKQYERIAELITHLCERVGCESDIETYLSEQPDWRNIPGLSSKSENWSRWSHSEEGHIKWENPFVSPVLKNEKWENPVGSKNSAELFVPFE
jgi:hypothetical protein